MKIISERNSLISRLINLSSKLTTIRRNQRTKEVLAQYRVLIMFPKTDEAHLQGVIKIFQPALKRRNELKNFQLNETKGLRKNPSVW
jgi:hypothetical protein